MSEDAGMPSVEEMQAKQQQAAAMEEQRLMILEQILEPEARDRLHRMSLVKAEKSRRIEDSLIAAARSGQLKSKLTEQQLIQMIEQIAATGEHETKVKIQRKRYDFDEDDDDDSDLL